MSQTDNALTRQYEALLAVDHVHLHFEESALDALAQEIQKELGGTVRRYVASAEDPQVEILA